MASEPGAGRAWATVCVCVGGVMALGLWCEYFKRREDGGGNGSRGGSGESIKHSLSDRERGKRESWRTDHETTR